MLLTALQVLEHRTGALLLSYEALDVEQIGHVYEGLLERTVKRVPETTLGLIGSQKAINPNVPLSELEAAKAAGEAKLLAYLLEKTGRSESGLKSALKKPVDEPLYHRVLLACSSDLALADRIKPFAVLLRTDNWGDPLAYRENAFIVTLGAGRRETGTHYTPKSLTEPIVQHTLEPLVYLGPAEGKPQSEWRLKSPHEILALKVCDMAMGSGAFLVQTCRWLGDRLVEAWDAAEKSGQFVAIEGEVLAQAGDAELVPRDQAERVLIARRLIANRCLYGVDINPMAVELAKLSLWLVTLMKGRPFSFLDHALKCGDSLLGVSSLKQIENFSLRLGERQVTFATANLFRYVEEASDKRRELEALPSNDYAQIEAKSRLNLGAETATAKVKALADCLVAFELRGLDGEQYEQQRAIVADHVEVAMRKPLLEFQAYAREQLRGRRPFHWPAQFPEVFGRGGFDAFVGNPPFAGGKRISSLFGDDYQVYLKNHLAPVSGSADLSAYFFLRSANLLATEGTFGLLATNTISQGDTREVGLDQLPEIGNCQIFRAINTLKWPGQAAVFVSLVHVRKNGWKGMRILDGKPVGFISSFLDIQKDSSPPGSLIANDAVSHMGSVVFGAGFRMPEQEALRLISGDPKYRDVLFPFLNGIDINSHVEHKPLNWVINFHDWTLEKASRYTACIDIVREKVLPLRAKSNRKTYREKWWLFAERQTNLYKAVSRLQRCLVTAFTSDTLAFVFVEPNVVFSNATIVVAWDDFGHFATIQSDIHTSWARRYGSTMKGDARYTPTNCFQTFPFPLIDQKLLAAGQAFYDERRRTSLSRNEGLTALYNRFNDPDEQSADITQLRVFHVEMNQAVAAAYGWSDLDLGHGFHATKQGERYTISESARRTVLDRLLALNHQRYAEEVAAGLHDKGAKKGKSKKAKSTDTDLGDLFEKG